MKRSLALTSMLLSVGLVNAVAQPAEMACADLATGFNEIGTLSLAEVYGSQQEIESMIAAKAAEHGASYYRIVALTERYGRGTWNAQAILYA